MKDLIPTKRIEQAIFLIRGHKVILDTDLARIYGVPTKRLNEQVKRNRHRFPEDFAFQLTAAEFSNLRSQFVTLSPQPIDLHEKEMNWSQFATSSSRHRGAVYRPYAFTEHGAIMAANVLNSRRAVQMSVFVVRAFVKMRSILTDTRDLARKLAALEKELKGRLNIHEAAIVTVLQRVMDILDPPPSPSPPQPRRIGFRTR
jgi:phage regulator Rha-like protein